MPMNIMAKSTSATTDIVDEQQLLKLLDGYIEDATYIQNKRKKR